MKFLYIADTHLGGSDRAGYRQQERYLAHFEHLMAVFAQWIKQRGDIDFVIHGGDMVENSSTQNIVEAVRLFEQLPCPVYLSLGNHDLTEGDSVNKWLALAPDFFCGRSVDFSFVQENVKFDLLSCHWGKQVYRWNDSEPQIPYLNKEQIGLTARDRNNYHVLVTHSPVFGLPPEQTGLDKYLHPPVGSFGDTIHRLALNQGISLVLGAHTHMNMHHCKDGIHYVTVSAFSEIPFEFKIFELNGKNISMETVSLVDKVDFNGIYNFDKTYTQGRPCDRSFNEVLI
ncbi:MAG: metallophosphoesterase [Victivallaceae bacterium]|nr:metallophosphoesterase [Victivallaceae bacterium]